MAESKSTQSLVSKLADVQAAIGVIAKTGRNTFQNYSYAEEAAIVEAVRGELAKRSIMVLPSIVGVTREDTLTTIQTRYTITDGDSGESLTCEWAGTGSDKQDKGLYKAITGSLKYFLLKTFLMPTGDNGIADDPEHPAREVATSTHIGPPQTPGGPLETEGYVAEEDIQVEVAQMPQEQKGPRVRRFDENGTELCTKKQAGLFASLITKLQRDEAVVGKHLQNCFDSPDPQDIPFKEFSLALDWLKSDEQYELIKKGLDA